jgi:4-amino-4-deoxy-L-arabinose transferase-like glycosyltransferase
MRRAAPAVLLFAIGGAMLAWSWRTWPDILVDFGREAYVAWRLCEGDLLYRDVATLNGPLSPYWNALWCRALGPELTTFIAVNLGLLAGLIGVLYRLLRRAGDALAATTACALVLLLFAFGQFTEIGNYNFVTPYSHELTHGLLLGLIAIACAHAHARTGRTAWLAAAGAALGLGALAKPETAAATAAALLLALLLAARRGIGLGELRAFGLGALLPPALAWGLLALPLGSDGASRALLAPWTAPWQGAVGELRFYRSGMGIDDVAGNAALLLAWSAAEVAVLSLGLALAWLLRRPDLRRPWTAAGLAAATAAGIALFRAGIPWEGWARPWPLYLTGLALACAVPVWRAADDAESRSRLELRLLLVVFSGVLLVKILLYSRIFHYGFALALPATCVVVVALLCWIPAALDARGAWGPAFRAVAFGALVAVAGAHLEGLERHFALKSFTVGRGPDRLRVERGRGTSVGRVIEHLEARLAVGGTLAVLPEGAMLNYLLRRPSSTPYANFMPPEVLLFGEQRMLEAFLTAPPDVVVIVHKDTSEYGLPLFGSDYGQALYDWVRRSYVSELRLGQPPLQQGTRFGIEVLDRR